MLSYRNVYSGNVILFQSDPVNLTLKEASENSSTGHNSPKQSNQQQHPTTPPLQQHVRTITLTSDYQRLHEPLDQHNHPSQQQVVENVSVAADSSMYTEEEQQTCNSQQTQDTTYYQSHQYVDDLGRYREVVVGKSGVPQMELLDAAAVAAGVPMGHYVMMEEEEDQNGQGSSSAFLGSRLATFQVIL